MHYAKITAHDAIKAGVLTQEEVEDARRNLSERVFREPYLAEPADSLTLIYSPFGPENVTEHVAEWRMGLRITYALWVLIRVAYIAV